MVLRIETEREDDGRWIGEARGLPGVMAYGESEDEARAKVRALAMNVVARRSFFWWVAGSLSAIALILLAGCAAPLVSACPPVPVYDQAFQTRLADELDALPPGSALGAAIIDYKRLRDVLRACR